MPNACKGAQMSNFTERLDGLMEKATKVHAGFSNEITAHDTGQKYAVTHLCRSDNGEVVAWLKNGQSAELIAYLVNRAPAIRDLVVAAQIMCGQAEGDDLEAEANMVQSLAKLEEA
jgi:hypothetical protein